jgi:hypothetical protein
MKKNVLLRVFNTLIAILLLSTFSLKSYAQTSLSVGDIAFTGYLAGVSSGDPFSFVLLKNIVANTPISFTDKGWRGSAFDAAGAIAPSLDETVVTWSHTAALVAGTEIQIDGLSANIGTVTGTALNLLTSGDQIFAFTGSVSSPNIISGIHMNVTASSNTSAASWDAPAAGVNGNTSQKPSGLTTGTNAIWIGTTSDTNSEEDNGKFNCSGTLTTVAGIRTAANSSANWTTSDGIPSFSLPSGCNFLGILPVELVDFRATQQGNIVELNWTTASELNNAFYDIEQSADGKKFSKIGDLKGAGTTNVPQYYTFAVEKPFSGIQYYRLKQVDTDGKFEYSKTVSIQIQKGEKIVISPSTTEGVITLKSEKDFIKKIEVANTTGQIVYNQNTIPNSSDFMQLNLSHLPTGIYLVFVKTENNNYLEKITKY